MLTLTLTSAYAGASNSSGVGNILNGQVDFNAQQSTLNIASGQVQGSISGASVAGGNAIDITTMNNTDVTNSQYVGATTIQADTYAYNTNIGGTTNLQSQATCNSASISMDPTSSNVYSSQDCSATDVGASVHSTVANTNNSVSLASAAVGNTMEEDSNAPYATVQNYQVNHSAVNTSTNVTASNIGGNLTASATSVGNTSQIIHYSTGN